MDSNKLRRLAGIPIDLSKVDNALATVRTPTRLIAEAAKVPQHRGELAPKTKDNMRARHAHAKKALEFLEQARESLMDLPAVDYNEDIPHVIKQLHQILHGDDGTGGLHQLHRVYKQQFDNTVFPEDIEEDKRKEEEEALAAEAGITGDEPDTSKKKKTNESLTETSNSARAKAEGCKNDWLADDPDYNYTVRKTDKGYDVVRSPKSSLSYGKKTPTSTVVQSFTNESVSSNPAPEGKVKSDGLGFQKQKVDPAKENKKPFKLADGSLANDKTMVDDKAQAKTVGEDPAERTKTKDNVQENSFGLSLGNQKAPSRRPQLSGSHSDEKIKPEVVQAVRDANMKKPEDKNPFGEEEEDDFAVRDPQTKKFVRYNTDPEVCDEPGCGKEFGKCEHTTYDDPAFDAEEEEDDLHCDTCGGTGQVKSPATGRMNDCGTCMGRGSIPNEEVDDEEDCSDMAGPMMGEGKSGKKPKWLEKAEVKAEEKEGKKVSAKEKKKVDEASGPLFARDAEHPKHQDEEKYSSWGPGTKPVNVVSDEEPSLYYPNGSKRENANQLSTNPYNENQKVNVPAKIKSALKTEADTARKLAETFTLRKDWDSKNFHETLANAFDTLNGFLEKGTIYGIKEAQVFMTSLMSPFTNKLPAEVVKYIAAGGTLRSLKSYVNDVKEPHTGTVFQQDSDGVK